MWAAQVAPGFTAHLTSHWPTTRSRDVEPADFPEEHPDGTACDRDDVPHGGPNGAARVVYRFSTCVTPAMARSALATSGETA